MVQARLSFALHHVKTCSFPCLHYFVQCALAVLYLNMVMPIKPLNWIKRETERWGWGVVYSVWIFLILLMCNNICEPVWDISRIGSFIFTWKLQEALIFIPDALQCEDLKGKITLLRKENYRDIPQRHASVKLVGWSDTSLPLPLSLSLCGKSLENTWKSAY